MSKRTLSRYILILQLDTRWRVFVLACKLYYICKHRSANYDRWKLWSRKRQYRLWKLAKWSVLLTIWLLWKRYGSLRSRVPEWTLHRLFIVRLFIVKLYISKLYVSKLYVSKLYVSKLYRDCWLSDNRWKLRYSKWEHGLRQFLPGRLLFVPRLLW